MQIGIITDNLDAGLKAGTQRYTLQLVRSLLSIDRKNNYTLIHGKASDLDIYRHKNVRELVMRKHFKQVFKEMVQLPIGLRREKLDVIHQTAQLPPVFPKPKAKVVATVLDLTPLLLPRTHVRIMRYYYKYLLPAALRRVDAIAAISECTKRDLVEHYRIPAGKIHVTYCGADEQYYPRSNSEIEGVKSAHNITGDYILYVGSLEPRKNVPTLLNAFAKLKHNQRFKDTKLVLAGAKAWLYHDIFKVLDSTGARNDVIIPGFVKDEDLPALYSGASVFAYPSLYEGFGLPPLEAMACGCPVITSNTSSLPEVVGDAGIMLAPTDASGLAESLASILSDKKLSKSLSRKGISRAGKFTWKGCAQDTLKIYEGLLR